MKTIILCLLASTFASIGATNTVNLMPPPVTNKVARANPKPGPFTNTEAFVYPPGAATQFWTVTKLQAKSWIPFRSGVIRTTYFGSNTYTTTLPFYGVAATNNDVCVTNTGSVGLFRMKGRSKL